MDKYEICQVVTSKRQGEGQQKNTSCSDGMRRGFLQPGHQGGVGGAAVWLLGNFGGV